jgi:hypothetical protein
MGGELGQYEGKRNEYAGYCRGHCKEKYNFKDLTVDGGIILKNRS